MQKDNNPWDVCYKRISNLVFRAEEDVDPSHILLWMGVRNFQAHVKRKTGDSTFTLWSLTTEMSQSFEKIERWVDDRERQQVKNISLSKAWLLETLFQQQMTPKVREETGSFYTHPCLADFMVRETLHTHAQKHGIEIRDEKIVAANSNIPFHWFHQLTVLDLSCGSGIFLRRALVQLLQLSQRIYQNAGIPWKGSMLAGEIIQRQLTGVDQQSEALGFSELLMKVEVFRWMEKEELLEGKERVGELFHQPCRLYLGDALQWQPAPFHTQFQLVFGNPPYLGERGNRRLFSQLRKSDFGVQHYEKNMDLFYYFVYKGIECMSPDGCLCYITPSYFTTADGASSLRRYLKENTEWCWLVYPENTALFADAKGHHNLIFCVARKGSGYKHSPALLRIFHRRRREELLEQLWHSGIRSFDTASQLTIFQHSDQLYDSRGQIVLEDGKRYTNFWNAFQQASLTSLDSLGQIRQGLVSGADQITAKNQSLTEGTPGMKQGIFVLNQEEKNELIRKDERVDRWIKPFHKNRHIEAFGVSPRADQWILYLTDHNLPFLDEQPVLKAHLQPFRSLLSKRREVCSGLRLWHTLHWPRAPEIFENPKIVSPQRAPLNRFALVEEPWYASADVYLIQLHQSCPHSLKSLLGWLNSAACFAWLHRYGKRKGEQLELYATPLKKLPVPIPPNEKEKNWVEEKVNELRLLNGHKDLKLREWTELDVRMLEWLGISVSQSQSLLDDIHSLRKRHCRF